MLTAQLAVPGQDGPLYTCRIEDASDVLELQGLTTADDWKTAFIEAAEGRRGRELTTAAVELSSGPAIRADWSKLPTTAWVVSDDDHVIVLLCSSKRPPAGDLRSIANTIEFLPDEE